MLAAVQHMLVAPIGGFQDPAENDRYIAEGKADMIYMARAYICDFDYYKKSSKAAARILSPVSAATSAIPDSATRMQAVLSTRCFIFPWI